MLRNLGLAVLSVSYINRALGPNNFSWEKCPDTSERLSKSTSASFLGLFDAQHHACWPSNILSKAFAYTCEILAGRLRLPAMTRSMSCTDVAKLEVGRGFSLVGNKGHVEGVKSLVFYNGVDDVDYKIKQSVQ